MQLRLRRQMFAAAKTDLDPKTASFREYLKGVEWPFGKDRTARKHLLHEALLLRTQGVSDTASIEDTPSLERLILNQSGA